MLHRLRGRPSGNLAQDGRKGHTASILAGFQLMPKTGQGDEVTPVSRYRHPRRSCAVPQGANRAVLAPELRGPTNQSSMMFGVTCQVAAEVRADEGRYVRARHPVKESAPPAVTTLFRTIGAHADHAAVVITVVQGGNGGAGFMPLHVDGCEAAAISGEDIARHGECTDNAVLGEERLQALFRSRSGKTTNRKSNQ